MQALNAIHTAKRAAKHRDDVKREQAEQQARELRGNASAKMRGRKRQAVRLCDQRTDRRRHAAQHGVEVDKRKIELEEPVKAVGQALATVRLAAGVSTRMIVNIVAAGKVNHGIDAFAPTMMEAERAVLGSMMRSGEAVLLAQESLSSEDFYDPANAEIFSAMLAIRRRAGRWISSRWMRNCAAGAGWTPWAASTRWWN